MSGDPPPEPTIGRWTDGGEGALVHRALFYPNEVHSVGGEPESMKSWLLLFAAVQEIKLGNHVFFVDMEANDRSIVDRLQLLGATAKQIRERFCYFRPDDQINDADKRRFRSMVKRLRPSLVVLDGVTEAYSMHGLSINSAEDAASWFRNFSRQFQTAPTSDYDGPAIVELDHVTKDREGRGNWNIGTQHKKAGIKGAMYLVEPHRPLSKGKHGVSRLYVAKDSPGGVAWVRTGKNRRLVGDFHVNAEDGGIDAWIESASIDSGATTEAEAPLVETFKFRMLMQQVWDYIETHPSCSQRLLRASVTGTNEHIRTAVEQLMSEGYVLNEGNANRGQYRATQEFKALRVLPGGAE